MTPSPEPGPATNRSADVVVVGAGIVGSAIAYRLAESGRSVIVVDKETRPGAGSTSSSSAIVRFHYGSLDNMAMAWDSYHAWIDWPSELGGVDPEGMAQFRVTGGLLLGGPDSFGEMADNLDELGIENETFSTAGLVARFPGMDPSCFGPPACLDDPDFAREASGCLGGLFTPDAGYVNDPQLAACNYAWAAKQLGALFLLGHRVTDVLQSDGRVDGVELDDKTQVKASRVVNAAGPASDELLQLAGVAEAHPVRSRALRAETHAVPAPSSFRGEQACFVIDPDLGSAFRPEIGDLVHISNIEPECDELDWLVDPWDFSPYPTQAIYQTQVMRVARRLPELAIRPGAVGLGAVYDVTPDWHPLLDVSELPGLYLACGTSGNSFKTAPTIAHLIRDLIDWTEAGHDHDSNPLPFVTPRIGRSIDTSRFSRRRTLASTTNVIA